MRFQSEAKRLNLPGRGSSKQQSAMEYLMTYGWAILIIAVVLGVLYYLGVFNSSNLAPRLQPGSCHVARTAAGVQNFGVCAGLPEFVAKFDGSSSFVDVLDSPSLEPASLTLSAWVYPSNSLYGWADEGIIGKNYGSESYLLTLEQGPTYPPYMSPSGFIINSNGENWVISGLTSSLNTWEFVTLTYNASTSTETFYVNGQSYGTKSANAPLINNNGDLVVGARDLLASHSQPSRVFQGDIANAQVYNASLSASEVKALYMEGIGGAPIVPQSVVGWWPLNGDANDYSGNNNNGQANNVQYTNTWLSSYSAP